MNRFEREQAHILELDDILTMLEAEAKNICLDRMVFLQARDMKNKESRIYPCYPVDMKTNESGDKRELYMFVVQNVAGRYNTAYLCVPEKDIGVTCRFWNLPPSQDVIDKNPLTDTSEVQ